ncbi:MAG: hypothetical protein QG657_3970 [Acidobacteriota bacterium]|nr:hypothetical protein [Acidobacteriota bacterium]
MKLVKMRLMTVVVVVLMLIINLGPGAAESYAGEPRLVMKKIVEVGKEGEILYSLYSVCEDDEGNFYIMDGKRYNLLKFSPEGKKLLNFGNSGEGPGDFKSPSQVFFSENNGVVVTEMMNEATIFTKEGKVVKKINFAKTLGLLFNIRYIGGDLFYAEKQGDIGVRYQILMNSEGKIVNSDLFLGSGWEIIMEDGMRYSLSFDELTPHLIFGGYKSFAVVGKSDCYKLKIINDRGQVIKEIGRNVKGSPLTTKENQHFSQEINDIKEWSPQVKKAFHELIPTEKMYYKKVMITSRYVFVFRIKEDTTDQKSPYPVDIFEIDGKFLGEVSMPALPMLVSDKYIYFREGDNGDEDAPLYLSKYSYNLSF